MRNLRSLVAVIVLLTASVVSALTASSAIATPRIIGGGKAPDAQYQSHLRSTVAIVALNERNQFDGQFCAGTLIDELHVLTAGHCLVSDGDLRTRLAPSSFAILAGAPKLNPTSLDRAQLVPVQTYFVNPNFNIKTLRWDMAVLRLARPITTVPEAAVLTQAEADSLGMGSGRVNALVAGWGDMDPDLDGCCFPTELQSVSVPVQADSACENNLSGASYVSFTTEFQFCAGRLGSGRALGADSCQGDSGGPIFVDVAGAPRLAGVTSFGVGCGQRYYGVYARWSSIGSWLDSIPGVRAGDTRNPAHGAGDLGTPTATYQPTGYSRVRLTITPPATGVAPEGYTVWARVGSPAVAEDIFLGTTTQTSYSMFVPATRSLAGHQLLIRATGPSGEGVPLRLRARPWLDTQRPSATGGLRVARSGAFITATWRAASDRQSGIDGYFVQRKAGSRWLAPKFVADGQRLRLRVGASTRGAIRVRAVDRAGNLGAQSAAVSF